MRLPSIRMPLDQAVYGSFPFWRRGYDVLARSSGCQPGWLAALKAASQRYGERPAGAVESEALFAMPLHRGPWMIVGVSPQGCDDEGRPGALAFHALFVDRWSYACAGANPFAFGHLLQRDWRPADVDAQLPGMPRPVRRAESRRVEDPSPGNGDRFTMIVQALTQGRRVAVQSIGPIDDLARAVWRALPWRVRLRTSVATWVFDDSNRFDLAAFPKLTGIRRATTDLIFTSTESLR
jgi:hypothetical protein